MTNSPTPEKKEVEQLANLQVKWLDHGMEHTEIVGKIKAEAIIKAGWRPTDADTMPSVEAIEEALRPIASTHHPIERINGECYHYMSKKHIAQVIHSLLTKGEVNE